MLERILPPTFALEQLPERESRGAKLVVGYCVQCHNLPNPAMHHAAKWPGIVQRMVLRMEGKGNMGTLMAEMMAGVKAPGAEDTQAIDRLPRAPRAEAARPGALSGGEPALGRGVPPGLQPVPHAARSAAPHRGANGARWWRACRRTWSG